MTLLLPSKGQVWGVEVVIHRDIRKTYFPKS